MKIAWRILLLLLTAIFITTGCGNEKSYGLNPKKPVTIVFWHYHSGMTKAVFDGLVAEFNRTVGAEKGIVVDARSQGDRMQLAKAVREAAEGTIGAQSMPDLFLAYPPEAYEIDRIAGLVSFETYFTEDELRNFRQEFLDEGRLDGQDIKIFPLFKSTDVLFLNETDWQAFDDVAGFGLSALSTWEGIADAARVYYEWTARASQNGEGHAFVGIDSMALKNLMYLIAKQQGETVASFVDGKVRFSLSETAAQRFWDLFYTPFLRGYYASNGHYASDDVKTGDVIAYVGSSAGAVYFPNEVKKGRAASYAVDCRVLPYPRMAEGRQMAMQRGAGVCIRKGDEKREFASTVFLKWFTQPEKNALFAASTGYLPVRNEAMRFDLLKEARGDFGVEEERCPMLLTAKTELEMLESYAFFSSESYEYSYEVESILEKFILRQAKRDRQAALTRIESGEEREMVLAKFTGEENFRRWYAQLEAQIDLLNR